MFESLKAEWRHLSKNRILIVSMIVMLFIPIMYGGFFLGSIWDPYGNTQHLPVAIVNNDEGAEVSGNKIAAGDELVEQLSSDRQMDWQFVDTQTAADGIENGEYYMMIEVPSDFSASIATVTSGQPKKAELRYTTTPARNYVASLLTRQAAEKIEASVSESVRHAYLDTLVDSISKLTDGVGRAADGAVQVVDGQAELSDGIIRYTNGVVAAHDGQESLLQGVRRLSTGAASLSDGLYRLQNGLPSNTDMQTLRNGLAVISAGLSELHSTLAAPDSTIAGLQSALQSSVWELQAALNEYSQTRTDASADIVTITALSQSTEPTVSVEPVQLARIVDYIDAADALPDRVGNLLVALTNLQSALQTQQNSLLSSVGSLDGGMGTVAPLVDDALGGYAAVDGGVSELRAGASELNAGLANAEDGSSELLNGLGQLTARNAKLVSGTIDLTNGARELSDGLTMIQSELSAQVIDSSFAEQAVEPVTLREYVDGHVPNYGYALSPYVLSLGLYVGALVFNVIYPIRRHYDRPKNGRAWWMAKMSVAGTVAIGQALVLDSIMILGLGLHPDNLAQFILLSLVVSVTNMSIITFLVLTLDNIGRFLAMLLLVLQLGSSAGVFPIVLSGQFFQSLNPFMPMTYSIWAFRESISSGMGGDVYWRNLLVLIATAVVANVLIVAFLRRHGVGHFAHESVDDDD